ncbi:MAG: hypothetical protein ACRDTD_27045 [Pseudonocardiaceae bacterium]
MTAPTQLPPVFWRFVSSPDAIFVTDHDGATAIGDDPLVRPPAPEVVQAMQAMHFITGTTALGFTGRAPEEINAFYARSPALAGASEETRNGADLTFDLGDGDSGTILVVGRHGLVRPAKLGGIGRIVLTDKQQKQLDGMREDLGPELTQRFGAAGLNVKIENAVGGASLIEALNAVGEPQPDPPNTVTLAFTENGVCMHTNQLEPRLAERVSAEVAQLVRDRGWGEPGGNPNEYVALRANRGQGFATTRSNCPAPDAPCVFVGDDAGDLKVLKNWTRTRVTSGLSSGTRSTMVSPRYRRSIAVTSSEWRHRRRPPP